MPMIVTKETGGKTMPVSMTVCEPSLAVTESQLKDQVLPDSGLNAPFLAGTLSAFLAHERAGAALYRVARQNTQNPMLSGRYEEFGRETEEHIAIYEQLIARLGGDPGYVSPVARLTEHLGSKLLEGPVLLAGSVDEMTLETAFLEAVIVAEHKCHDNWKLVARLATELPEGEARRAVQQAVGQVEDQEDGHVQWATETWQQMAITQAKHPVMSKAGEVVQGVIGKVKQALT